MKRIRTGNLATSPEIQRFKREAEAAASLEHPNIVPIHEVGEVAGEHFFSMRLIEGGNLAEALHGGTLSLPELGADASRAIKLTEAKRQVKIARLLATIARAVHHAHQRGILHRDLKPTNILLDEAGEPHLTDFGLAKLLDGPTVTQSLAVIGTPAYMAPEQASGESRQLTTAVDVYSLGAILYECLGGRAPFVGPSAVSILSQLRDRDPDPLAKMNAYVDRDLATIASRCLEKDPERRYPSALALAEDLERFLRKEPIWARRVSTGERLWRWSRRQPALAGSLAALLLAMVIGLGGILSQWQRAQRHAQREARERQRAQEAVFRLTFDKAENLFSQDRAAQGLAHLAQLLRLQPTNQTVAARIQSALSLRPFCLPLATHQHSRIVSQIQFSPDGLWALSASSGSTVLILDTISGARRAVIELPAPVLDAEISGDSRRLLTACRNGTVSVWEIPSGRLAHEELRFGHPIERAAFSRNGLRVAVAMSNSVTKVWDLSSGRPIGRPMEHARELRNLRFSHDGQLLATATLSSRQRRADVRAWRVETGAPLGPTISDVPEQEAQFSPDQTEIWVGNTAAYDPVSGRLLRTLAANGEWSVLSGQFSPDGKWLLTGSQDATVRLWDWRQGTQLAQMRHDNFVLHTGFNLDGQLLLSSSRDGTARLWTAEGRPASEPMHHGNAVSQVFVNSHLSHVMTCALSNVWLWEVHTGYQPRTFAHQAGLLGAAFSQDGRRLLTTSQDQTARLWDVETGSALATPFQHLAWVNDVKWSPDNRFFLTGAQDGMARLWDPDKSIPVWSVTHKDHVRKVLFHPDGSRLYTASFDGSARMWDTRTGQSVGDPMRHPSRIHSLQLSPDTRKLLTASQDGTVQLWDAATTHLVLPPIHGGRSLLNARFTPDGKRFVTVANDRKARVWDVSTGQLVGQPVEHPDELAALSPDFTADSRLVLTAAGNLAQIWEIETGRPIAPGMSHQGVVRSASFSPDNQMVVTTSADRTARLWDASNALPISEPMEHHDVVVNAYFSPNGRSVLTLGNDSAAKLWEVPIWGEPVPEWLADLADAVGGLHLNDRNMLEAVPPERYLELRSRLQSTPKQGLWGQWLSRFLSRQSLSTTTNASSVR